MSKTLYKKKIKNGKEYYFYRLRHKNLVTPKDLYGSTIAELEDKIRQVNNELEHGINGDKETFGAFLENFLFETHLKDKKPSTKERYEGLWRNYIKGAKVTKKQVRDITLRDIQEYYNALETKKNTITGGVCSVPTIKNINKIISPAIKYACANNLIAKDFSKYIKLPSVSDKLRTRDNVRAFSKEEQQKFMDTIKGKEYEAFYITALATGIREGELLALTWDDIDYKNGKINIDKTVMFTSDVTNKGRSNGYYAVNAPKSKAGIRNVTMPAYLTPILKQQSIKCKAQKILLANLWNDNNLVFPNTYGNYKDGSNLLKDFKRILHEAGLPEYYTVHSLRHTFATRMFEMGEEVKTVSKLLGHSSTAVTLETYTWVLEDLKVKAASKMDELYKEMTKGQK